MALEVSGPDTVIEAPPGFKFVAFEIARRTGASVSGRAVWGSCDVGVRSGNVVHLGHGVPPNIAARLERHTRGRVEKLGRDLYVLRHSSGIAYFVPVYYRVPETVLGRLDVEVPRDSYVYYPLPYRLIAEFVAEKLGLQLLDEPMTGCWVPKYPDKPSLVVASGLFYPLTLKLLNPDVRVFALDPFSKRLQDVDREFKRLAGLKARAWLSGGSAAVLVTSKPGQMVGRETINRVASRLGAVVVEVDEASPELIDDLPVDYVVNTACPRIGFDDLDRISKPVINIGEVLRGYDLRNVLHWPL